MHVMEVDSQLNVHFLQHGESQAGIRLLQWRLLVFFYVEEGKLVDFSREMADFLMVLACFCFYFEQVEAAVVFAFGFNFSSCFNFNFTFCSHR